MRQRKTNNWLSTKQSEGKEVQESTQETDFGAETHLFVDLGIPQIN